MHIYFTFLSFLLGLVLASFLNALLYRIDNGFKYPDIFLKGSHCEKCGKLLSVYELVPVLSFIFFKGKCTMCGYRVPMYYPFSELLLGIGMGSIYFYSLPYPYYIVLLFFFSFSYFDRIYKGIPQVLVNTYLIVMGIYFFFNVIVQDSIVENSLLVGILLSTLIYILSRLFKKPFGLGDILVLIGLSVVFSINMYIGYIYIFLILSSVYSVTLVILKRASFKSSIPLLPFMYASLSLLFLFNELISALVQSIFYF